MYLNTKPFDVINKHQIILFPCTVDNIFRPCGIRWREWSIQIYTRSFIGKSQSEYWMGVRKFWEHHLMVTRREQKNALVNLFQMICSDTKGRTENVKQMTYRQRFFLSLKSHLWLSMSQKTVCSSTSLICLHRNNSSEFFPLHRDESNLDDD